MNRNCHFYALWNKNRQLTKKQFENVLIFLLFWLIYNKLFYVLKYYIPRLFYFSFYWHEIIFINGYLDAYKLITFSLVNIFSKQLLLLTGFLIKTMGVDFFVVFFAADLPSTSWYFMFFPYLSDKKSSTDSVKFSEDRKALFFDALSKL